MTIPVQDGVPVNVLLLGGVLQTVGCSVLVVDVLLLGGVGQPVRLLAEGVVVPGPPEGIQLALGEAVVLLLLLVHIQVVVVLAYGLLEAPALIEVGVEVLLEPVVDVLEAGVLAGEGVLSGGQRFVPIVSGNVLAVVSGNRRWLRVIFIPVNFPLRVDPNP